MTTRQVDYAKRVEGWEAVLTKNAAGRFHVNLVAGTGQLIASRETYESRAAALNGIETVRSNAPSAPTDDRT